MSLIKNIIDVTPNHFDKNKYKTLNIRINMSRAMSMTIWCFVDLAEGISIHIYSFHFRFYEYMMICFFFTSIIN